MLKLLNSLVNVLGGAVDQFLDLFSHIEFKLFRLLPLANSMGVRELWAFLNVAQDVVSENRNRLTLGRRVLISQPVDALLPNNELEGITSINVIIHVIPGNILPHLDGFVVPPVSSIEIRSSSSNQLMTRLIVISIIIRHQVIQREYEQGLLNDLQGGFVQWVL